MNPLEGPVLSVSGLRKSYDGNDALINSRIPRLLEFAGLASKGGASIRTLSGGMKRRLTLARALINDFELLMLDEPTTGLDPQARHLIWDGLRQLLTQGKTILLTTHFMDEAERLCTRLAVIDRGRMIASDAPRALIAQHVEPEVIEVYGDEARSWANHRGRALADRLELTGETAFCYARDAATLLAELAYANRHRVLATLCFTTAATVPNTASATKPIAASV